MTRKEFAQHLALQWLADLRHPSSDEINSNAQAATNAAKSLAKLHPDFFDSDPDEGKKKEGYASGFDF